jgi:hypothetical protein
MIRKLHYLLVAACLSSAVQLYAQSEGKRIYYSSNTKHSSREIANRVRTTNCGPDTLLYPYLKELTFSAPNDSFFIDAMVNNVRTASQAYTLNTSLNVIGVQFWGAKYTTGSAFKTLQARVYLYLVDTDNKPIATLDSATVTINNNYDFYEAVFAKPRLVSSNFAVGVKSAVNDTLAVMTNNAGAPGHTPNYGEGLAWRRFGSGAWNSAASFFGQDMDYMIFPIVTYSVSSAFTTSSNSVCSGKAITFTNTSPSLNLISNRMVNLYAYDAYWSFAKADSSIKWNFGDSVQWKTMISGTHTYPAAGNYNAKLVSNVLGYYTSCADTASTAIKVNEKYTTLAKASICEGGSYTLGTQTLTTAGIYQETFTSTGSCDSTVILTLKVDTVDVSTTAVGDTLRANAIGASYQWIDCNKGNAAIPGDTNRAFHPTANGSYAVIVTQGACADTSACIPYIGTGIGTHAAALQVTAFPNPVTDQLTIQCRGHVPDRITIRNVLGEVVFESRPSSENTLIEMSRLASAVYFVQVAYKENTKTIRITKR